MKNVGAMKLDTPGETDIVMSRVFDAPRKAVFEAYTKPELLKKWLGVQDGWTFAVCKVDLRVGGAYRYEWRGKDGKTMGMGGTFREVKAPERIVATEKFDEAWYPGEALDSFVMTEQNGKTTVTVTVRYDSRAARDAVLKTPMEKGMAASFDKLAELLTSSANA
jgi:uncharacterized protein YndB with AHSA1/START domain